MNGRARTDLTRGTRAPHRPASRGGNGQGNQNTGPLVLIRALLAMPDFASAPCAESGVDPETFWPVDIAGLPGEEKLAAATAYCDRCDQADACLLWALETSQPGGVWGGMRLDGMLVNTRRQLRDQLRRRTA